MLPTNMDLLDKLQNCLRLCHPAGAREEQQESRSSHEHSQSLSDGRLNVGTHLPLMAKRYAYLSLIGEGSSAQVSNCRGKQSLQFLCCSLHGKSCVRCTAAWDQHTI